MLIKIHSPIRRYRPRAAAVAFLGLFLGLSQGGAGFSRASAAEGDVATGEGLFKQKCSACHQITGKGIKGAFPALAGNSFVQGDPQLVARTVLGGRGGMPSFAPLLEEQQIADILSYVRQAWGNSATPISAELVHEVKENAKPQDKAPTVTH